MFEESCDSPQLEWRGNAQRLRHPRDEEAPPIEATATRPHVRDGQLVARMRAPGAPDLLVGTGPAHGALPFKTWNDERRFAIHREAARIILGGLPIRDHHDVAAVVNKALGNAGHAPISQAELALLLVLIARAQS